MYGWFGFDHFSWAGPDPSGWPSSKLIRRSVSSVEASSEAETDNLLLKAPLSHPAALNLWDFYPKLECQAIQNVLQIKD